MLTNRLKGFTKKVVLPLALGIGLSYSVAYGYTAKPKIPDKIEDINKIEIYQDKNPDIRTLSVDVLVDEEFVDKYGDKWEKKVDEYFKEVSKNYLNNFGIEFEIVNYSTWHSDNYMKDYCDLLDKIASYYDRSGSDLKVALTGQRDKGWFLSLFSQVIGRGTMSGKYSINYDNNQIISTLLHEIGHNFGLDHVQIEKVRPVPILGGPCSVMEGSASKCMEWDEKSKKEMMKNKWRRFK